MSTTPLTINRPLLDKSKAFPPLASSSMPNAPMTYARATALTLRKSLASARAAPSLSLRKTITRKAPLPIGTFATSQHASNPLHAVTPQPASNAPTTPQPTINAATTFQPSTSLSTSTSINKNICPMCGKQYQQHTGLYKHVQKQHNRKSLSSSSSNISCQEEGCSYTSRYTSQLREHSTEQHGW